MKKILSWCGSHTELLCAFFLLGCCISSAVKDGWSVAILFLPFIAMWIFTYHLQKEISRLIKKSLFYYRYLLAQNDVNLCKKKISCGDYLSNRKYYENMIEFYLKKILDKVV